MMPGKPKVLNKHSKLGVLLDIIEQLKASIRVKVQHPFHIVKNLFNQV